MEFHIYLLFLQIIFGPVTSDTVQCSVVWCGVVCTVHCILYVGVRQTEDQLAVVTPAPILSAGLLRPGAATV